MITNLLGDGKYCDLCCKWKSINKVEIEHGSNFCIMSIVMKVAEVPLVLSVST